MITKNNDAMRSKSSSGTAGAELPSAASDQKKIKQSLDEVTNLVALKKILSRVLSVRLSELDDSLSFIDNGGDSVMAIELSTICASQDISISVSDIIKCQSLEILATNMKPKPMEERCYDLERWSLVPESQHEAMRKSVREQCNLPEHAEIIDILPATALQEGFMALAAKQPGSYMRRYLFELGEAVDIERFKKAWGKTLDVIEILRTRLVLIDGRTWQAKISEDVNWPLENRNDNEKGGYKMGYGTRLSRWAFVAKNGQKYFELTMHHAIFDAWCVQLISNTVMNLYENKPHQVELTPYENFVNFTLELDQQAAGNYWRHALKGAQRTDFPQIKQASQFGNRISSKSTGNIVRCPIALCRSKGAVTMATVLRAAWAIVLASHDNNSEDVVFGSAVSGRQAPVSGIERMVGPVISTVPVRVKVEKKQTVSQFLRDIQAQAASMIPFEQMGLQNISRLGADTRSACEFSTLLVVQPRSILQRASNSVLVGVSIESKDAFVGYTNYPIVAQLDLHSDSAVLEFIYDSAAISTLQAQRMANQYEHVVQQLLSSQELGQENMKLGDISVCSASDAEEILRWNMSLPRISAKNECMHDLISSVSARYPTQDAIISWDGQCSYEEFELMTNKLGAHLQDRGVGPESVVPICFEKSMWTIVAMLAVMKAGGAFAPLSPEYPLARRQQIIATLTPSIILTSKSSVHACQGLGLPLVVISKSFISSLPTRTTNTKSVTPRNAAYALFTSGTTGTPKCFTIEHRAMVSSLVPLKDVWGFTPETRTLQFSNYVFDASIVEIFMTLLAGGTISVPSEGDRLSNIESFINDARITFALLTPSFVSTLDPSKVPTIKCLVVGGEAPSSDIVRKWAKKVRLFNAYGPAETVVCATTHPLKPHTQSPTTIGRGFNNRLWIVEQDNPDRLAGIGCVGELVIQGPGIARGYLNNSEKTKASFVASMPWLPKEFSEYPMAYRTGDLTRYNDDGTLEYIGRKDTQVKLRGQRLELEEIEHHIRLSLGADLPLNSSVQVVDGSGAGDALFAFICLNTGRGANASDGVLALDEENVKLLASIQEHLRAVLPAYMVPSFYLPVSRLPLTTSGKMDARTLKQWARSISISDLTQYTLTARAQLQKPETPTELLLQEIWADILKVPAASISRNDSFLQIGGDSISAIRLVAAARERGVNLTVASIFQDPRLSQIASSAQTEEKHNDSTIEPWALVPQTDRAGILQAIKQQSGIDEENFIEDVYPATLTQQLLVASTTLYPGAYMSRHVLELAPTTDINRFKLAWQRTFQACEILRTRIIKFGNQGFQAVIKQDTSWEDFESLELDMGYGTRLCRYSLTTSGNCTVFTLVVHHAIFDGWSFGLLMQFLMDTYEQDNWVQQQTPYNAYIKYVMSVDQPSGQSPAAKYWRTELEGATRPTFPRKPNKSLMISKSGTSTNLTISHEFAYPQGGIPGITSSTVLRAAWAIVLARYSDNTKDITFCAGLAGRQAPVQGIEKIIAPVVTSVPVRIRLSERQLVGDFLAAIQSKATEMIPFEHMGVQNIAKLSSSALDACQFNSVFLVQPKEILEGLRNGLFTDTGSIKIGSEGGSRNYFTIPLVFRCHVQRDSVELRITIDTLVLEEAQIQIMAKQFCHVVQQLVTTKDRYIQDISLNNDLDMSLSRQWNLGFERRIVSSTFHQLVEEQARIQPNAPAVSAWDGELSYRELDDAASRLARFLLVQFKISIDELVAVCFEKSMWFFVAVLAINKAGGAWVPLDPSHPSSRHQTILEQSGARIVVTNTVMASQFAGLAKHTVELSSKLDEELLRQKSQAISVDVRPQHTACVLFTPGTTGTPKGIIMEHGALCTSQTALVQKLGLSNKVRLLQFATSGFDLSIREIISPLIAGGCLCVPSEHERMNVLGSFINHARVNWAFLKPSIARHIEPASVPNLELLLLAGESVEKDLMAAWVNASSVRLLHGWGPSETCCLSSLKEWKSTEESPSNIGYPVGGRCWIVEPEDCSRLAPIGCLGEIVIQGPTIARGYLALPEATKARFIEKLPQWALEANCPEYSRFYKSGVLAYYNPDGTMEVVTPKTS